MTNLQTNKSLPFDKSYHKAIEDLHKWNTKILFQLKERYDNVLIDMNKTFDNVHYFASFTNALLIEQENQLEKARTNEEINIIQERINQILSEVQFLQTLSLRLNCNSVKLTGKLQINYNNNEINPRTISKSFDISLNNNYRFLISRIDAIELEKHLLPTFHLTSCDNESINECVLTFDVLSLDSFLNAFNFYWNLFPNNNEIRMLIPEYNISLIMGKLGEISRLLAKRFQLDQIKFFTNSCPKSDERILFINGKRRDLIKDCIEEIYFNIEEKNKNQLTDENIQLYNPANLSTDDINKIMLTNIDYGGFIQNQSTSLSANQSRLQITEDDNSETIQREMIINNSYAGVIIGVNATRIDHIKQTTGAYVYINGESSDLKRTVIIKGTRGQVNRAYACIENLIETHRNGKLPIKQRRSHGK